VNTPLPKPRTCVAPPAQFGRCAQAVDDLSGEGSAAGVPGHPAPAPLGDYRPRTLSVLLNDPVAAARSLRNHMQPADLIELIIILAEEAADVVRGRTTTH
jgi:hypothetical protein